MKTPNDTEKPALERAFVLLGPNRIARICGVKGPSACKWRANGRLPRTEWTGETNYAALIASAFDGEVTKEDLLKLPSRAVS